MLPNREQTKLLGLFEAARAPLLLPYVIPHTFPNVNKAEQRHYRYVDTIMATSKAPILTKCLEGGFANHRPPAKRLEDCIVGRERWNRQPHSWKRSQAPKRLLDADVAVGKRKRVDVFEASSLEHAVQTFLSSGCCVLPNVLPTAFVKDCRNKATEDLLLLNQELQKRRDAAVTDTRQLASAYRVDYREMVDRDGLRRDVRFDLDKWPYTASGLVYNNMVFPLVKELLGGDVSLLYAGVMWARHCLPSDDAEQKVAQKWHADGGHCFEHAHQPPHCINVFFPLIDLSTRHGPTEVKAGSHFLGQFDEPSLATFGLEGKAGDAMVFDYRLKHRGGINVSDQDRPVLYLAYAKPWFRDTGNTRSGASIFADARRSRPWVSRVLTGDPAGALEEGFENDSAAIETRLEGRIAAKDEHLGHGDTSNVEGSGEQWVLFKMNVQLDGDREETIVVHSGDVAIEVSTQFCQKHQLSSDFISILADTIQQQIDQ